MINTLVKRTIFSCLSFVLHRSYSVEIATGSLKFVISRTEYFSIMSRFFTNMVTQPENRIREDYISLIKNFVPKLTPHLHKGQCGRIGIIGGSLEYTGAPFFAAMSALKIGADLVYVFCCRDAAQVIKSYSPELIVNPLLDDEKALDKIKPWLERLHALVIGPGLGRDPGILQTVGNIINHCKNEMKAPPPLIVDADGLHLVTEQTNVLCDYPGAIILTPNAIEYSRLCEKLNMDPNQVIGLATHFNAVILKKGNTDVICNGISQSKLNLSETDVTTTCIIEGSNRRCGGQGDILSGCISVFVAWYQLHKNLNPLMTSLSDINELSEMSLSEKQKLYNERLLGFSLAVYAGCAVTRQCSSLAFMEFGRSMTATDMTEYIHEAFEKFFK